MRWVWATTVFDKLHCWTWAALLVGGSILKTVWPSSEVFFEMCCLIIQPLTPILIIKHSLSTSYIYCDPPCSITCLTVLFHNLSSCVSSLVYLLVWNPLLHVKNKVCYTENWICVCVCKCADYISGCELYLQTGLLLVVWSEQTNVWVGAVPTSSCRSSTQDYKFVIFHVFFCIVCRYRVACIFVLYLVLHKFTWWWVSCQMFPVMVFVECTVMNGVHWMLTLALWNALHSSLHDPDLSLSDWCW